ncbi:MAG: methylated-DNA--[protein]-cysteine S-methyltransferase [Myxococcales bacterium]|nr:methylated-DNA--[protein]-cysteine S-methyltransferase [Myxococcales bacterium]
MPIQLSRLDSPLGPLQLAVGERGLCALLFAASERPIRAFIQKVFPGATVSRGGGGTISARVRCYFDGELSAIDRLEVDPAGTPFQLEVWRALRRIPAGRTASYRELAASIGRPGATRAVGAANGANPIALVVPCHRVIASGGELGGYSAGLERKAWLLRHEGAWLL